MQRKAVSYFKVPKTRDLRLLANKMHEPQWRYLSAEGEFHEQHRTHDPRLPHGPGIGAGLAVLLAPRSGEETREWIADTAERKFKALRRVGRRSFRQLQDAVAEGEEMVTGALRNGKKALESVAAKLD